ncbi:MAG: C40 family peptidase [Gaiellaceae bacterium]
MLRRFLAASAVALTVAPAALASPAIEVLGPGGTVIASSGPGSFDYPASGSVLHVGRGSLSAAGVELDDVSMLGGVIQIGAILVPSVGMPTVTGLVVAGRVVPGRVNGLVPLGPGTYLITAQAATTGTVVGRVGLRLTIGEPGFGVPVGTQVVVGLPALPARARHRTPGRATVAAPLAILGFSAGAPNPALDVAEPVPFFGTNSTGAQAVAIAERFVGVPYVWGGASPLTGFDCSGFAMFVYAQLGIHLTHYTGAQYNEGIPVAVNELQPGDLVFFEPSANGPQHEGIYIGGGQFIQAPHTGDAVKISSLSEPAYMLGYVGAVRPYGA